VDDIQGWGCSVAEGGGRYWEEENGLYVALGIMNDIVGMICPRLGNGRCLQFYCVVGFLMIISPCSDPDGEGHVPISFGKKLFCTCVIRHSGKPVRRPFDRMLKYTSHRTAVNYYA
jgi:hypothetical protein